MHWKYYHMRLLGNIRKLALAYFQKVNFDDTFIVFGTALPGIEPDFKSFSGRRSIHLTTDGLLRKSKHSAPLTLWAAPFYPG